MKPGQLCAVVATYIEDRNGRALVRLPNGSKTSIPHGSYVADSVRGHFVPAQDDSYVDVFCLDDNWSAQGGDFAQAADRLREHADSHVPAD